MTPKIVAVDWSGKRKGAAEHIWLAVVSDGVLVRLENGRERHDVVEEIVEICEEQPRTVVGLDFAFSFPAWYLDANDWQDGQDVWRAMKDRAEDLLRDCPSPFWGLTGRRNEHGQQGARATELNRGFTPKSVFQIGGAGAVGTGSLRGMPYLARLSEAGFWIWPFDPPGWPRVVEIYPRLLTEAVVKSRHSERLSYLERRYGDQPQRMLERAAGSEDAFDAAVSALVMAEHATELEGLSRAPLPSAERREGSIWSPSSI